VAVYKTGATATWRVNSRDGHIGLDASSFITYHIDGAVMLREDVSAVNSA